MMAEASDATTTIVTMSEDGEGTKKSSPEDEVAVSVSDGDEEESIDNGSYCYESDYSYESSDTAEKADEIDNVDDDECCGVGLKRKIPASIADIASYSKATKGGIKTPSLPAPYDSSSSPPSSLLPSAAAPREGGGEGGEDQNQCGLCHGELHTPVLDCALISEWMELVEGKACGMLSVHRDCIMKCMERRVRECQQRSLDMREEFPNLTDGEEIFDRDVDLIAVELRRHNWDADHWQGLYRRRLELQHQVQRARQVQDPLRAAIVQMAPAQVQRMIEGLGLDNNAPLIDANAFNNNNMRNYEDNVQRVHEEHESFLRATMLGNAAAAPLTLETPTSSSQSLLGNIVRPLAGMLQGLGQVTLAQNNPNPNNNNTQNQPANEGYFNMPFAAAAAAWTCEICMDDEVDEEDRLSMECGHEYCSSCWSQFINGMLEDARALGGIMSMPSYCPHRQCRHKITRSHVERMAPDLLPTYDEMALNSFLQGHSDTMRWCPGPDCEHVVVHSRRGLFLHEQGDDDRFAKCDYCNSRFCFDCGESPHPGRACLRIYDQEEAAIELERGEGGLGVAVAPPFVDITPPAVAAPARGAFGVVGRQGRDRLQQLEQVSRQEKQIDKKIRHCPSCNVPIEKNGGCNHMRCKCGHEFCWLCMAPNQHGMHFCGREPGLEEPALGVGGGGRNNRVETPALARMDLDYVTETVQQPEHRLDPETAQNLLKERQELHRFAHYYNRVMAHNQGQVFAENQCECLAGRAVDFTRVSELHSGTDTDFFQLSNHRLVASRRMLKYTYVFLYHKLASTSEEVGGGGFEDNECPMDSANSSSLPTLLALFLDHQERLERMTERLSFLSENALTRKDRKRVVDMINTVERCMKAVTDLSFEERDAKL